MDHADLYHLREAYNSRNILLCFNGPFSQGLIEEIGEALRKYMAGDAGVSPSSSAMDVFAVYIEITQNIQRYSTERGYGEVDSSATVVISRDDEGRYVINAGNIVEPEDGRVLAARIEELAALDKAELKAVYKKQLRQPRDERGNSSAGLGLIDIARKAGEPFSCALQPLNGSERLFFSLRVVI